jgi:alcohol dehydrogenase class IV
MGDVPIEKFNKSTFMNLANYAEKNGAQSMILVQDRNHTQKDDYRKLFKVLDAKRVRKSGMKDMMTEERIHDWIEKYALFKIEL